MGAELFHADRGQTDMTKLILAFRLRTRITREKNPCPGASGRRPRLRRHGHRDRISYHTRKATIKTEHDNWIQSCDRYIVYPKTGIIDSPYTDLTARHKPETDS